MTCVPLINSLPADIIRDSFDLVIVQWNRETQTLRRGCGVQKAFSTATPTTEGPRHAMRNKETARSTPHSAPHTVAAAERLKSAKGHSGCVHWPLLAPSISQGARGRA